MQNENGSILVLTVFFLLVLSLFGVASIHHSGMQNAEANKRLLSMEAFWLADSGIEKAKYVLQTTPQYPYTSSDSEVMDEIDCEDFDGYDNFDDDDCEGLDDQYSRSFFVTTIPDPDCPTCIDRWRAISQGDAGTQQRKIKAIIAKYDAPNAITAHGGVNTDCIANGNAAINGTCAEYEWFTLETVFGMSESDVRSSAAHHYIDPNNSGDINPVEDVTVVDLVIKNSINIDTANMPLDLVADPSGNTVKAAFLLIDTSPLGCVTPAPKVHIDGGLLFRGVIWVIGEAEIKGTSDIAGTVFVDGDPACNTKVTGNASITYSPAAIDEALNAFPSGVYPGTPKIFSWEEI